jgi:hypothetical protein
VSMAVSLVVAFAAAYPVNLFLLQRGRGHALTHGASAADRTPRRYVPAFSTATLVAAVAAFLLGGLLVSVAAR